MSEITLEQANTIIEAAHVEGKKRKLAPLTIVILDTGGHVKALSRADAASFSALKSRWQRPGEPLGLVYLHVN
jgi:uncharacterized protein GlcG (DUF336 family)